MTNPVIVPSRDGVQITVHHLGPDHGTDRPILMMLHATGFHGHIWQPVADHLVDDFDCWSFDFRGHGHSPLPTSTTPVTWDRMVADALAVIGAVTDVPVLAVGWSMGGAAVVGVDVAFPGMIKAAYLYEPILFPAASEGSAPLGNPLAEIARRRRAEFDSYDDAFQHYAAKPPFDSATPEALRVYVDYGFEPTPDGKVTLRCRPETESNVFGGWIPNMFDDFANTTMSVTIARSGDQFGPAEFAPLIANQRSDVPLETFEELSHFGPMEDPGQIAEAIKKNLANL